MMGRIYWRYRYYSGYISLLFEDQDQDEWIEYDIFSSVWIRRGNKRIRVTRRTLSLYHGASRFYKNFPESYKSAHGHFFEGYATKIPHTIKYEDLVTTRKK